MHCKVIREGGGGGGLSDSELVLLGSQSTFSLLQGKLSDSRKLWYAGWDYSGREWLATCISMEPLVYM